LRRSLVIGKPSPTSAVRCRPRRRAVLAALVGLGVVTGPAAAQTVAMDGDTLQMNGERIRLLGIDAPELDQTCDNGSWRAGKLAQAALAQVVNGRKVLCEGRARDRYGGLVAVCTVDGEDIGVLLAGEGWAWAEPHAGRFYQEAERRAVAMGGGVHAHQCVKPWQWRAAARSRK
jgi:endonuclease YncB( thermonuclease family)